MDGNEKIDEVKIDSVLEETIRSNNRDFESNYELSESEVLETGIKWIGKDYKQIGQP